MQDFYAAAARFVMASHWAFTAFVVLGQVAIVIGVARGSVWIRNIWFRATHLAAIAFVVAEAWFRLDCPLTVAEHHLRRLAGESPAPSEFMTRWIGRVTGFEPPLWTLTAVYTLFFATVLWAWWKAPPRIGESNRAPVGARPSPLQSPSER